METQNLQEMLDSLGGDIEDEMERRKEMELHLIKQYGPSELIDFLEEQLLATDVIFDGINMSGEIDPHVAIVLAGLMRTRHAVEGAAAWLQHNCVDKSDPEISDRGTNQALAALTTALDDEDL